MTGGGIDPRRAASSSDERVLRTFIAVDLPPATQTALGRCQTQLNQRLRDLPTPVLRWAAVEKLHLTLRFFGDTPPARRATLHAQLAATLPTFPPFALTLGELGGFPTLAKPRVVWVGVAGDVAALQGIQAAVEQIAQAVGFAPEEKAFTPHLTLARADRGARPADLQRAGRALMQAAASAAHLAAPLVAPVEFPVSEVVFYQSDLHPQGARYTPLARFPLAGCAAADCATADCGAAAD
jgi:2'-5' RNA ligase